MKVALLGEDMRTRLALELLRVWAVELANMHLHLVGPRSCRKTLRTDIYFTKVLDKDVLSSLVWTISESTTIAITALKRTTIVLASAVIANQKIVHVLIPRLLPLGEVPDDLVESQEGPFVDTQRAA